MHNNLYNELSFWENIFMMIFSIFLFVTKLHVNKTDKIYLFFTICSYALFFMGFFYLIGFDYQTITLGRLIRV